MTFMDGVNIAARLEAEAPAGGIVVSGALQETAAGKLQAEFVDLGRLTLKNIERQVQAYRVEWAKDSRAQAHSNLYRLGCFPAIAA